MSNSLNFCLNNIYRSGYTGCDFSNAKEYDTIGFIEGNTSIRFVNSEFEYYLDGTDEHGSRIKIQSKIVYSPDADFDYFTSAQSIHDGTILFLLSTMEECVNNIIGIRTYDKRKPRPINGATICYTIGNLVISNEYGDFGTPEKPWLHSRTTVLLPIKYDIKE